MGKTAQEAADNLHYARACVADSLSRGEAPFASHLLYTQRGILDDNNPRERRKGIKAGFEWHKKADKVCVYLDRGISRGMQQGIANAVKNNLPIEMRYLNKE